eukprot:SAG31_NODE_8316_length_1475_cov_1.656977_1_plen_81_part_00
MTRRAAAVSARTRDAGWIPYPGTYRELYPRYLPGTLVPLNLNLNLSLHPAKIENAWASWMAAGGYEYSCVHTRGLPPVLN